MQQKGHYIAVIRPSQCNKKSYYIVSSKVSKCNNNTATKQQQDYHNAEKKAVTLYRQGCYNAKIILLYYIIEDITM